MVLMELNPGQAMNHPTGDEFLSNSIETPQVSPGIARLVSPEDDLQTSSLSDNQSQHAEPFIDRSITSGDSASVSETICAILERNIIEADLCKIYSRGSKFLVKHLISAAGLNDKEALSCKVKHNDKQTVHNILIRWKGSEPKKLSELIELILSSVTVSEDNENTIQRIVDDLKRP